VNELTMAPLGGLLNDENSSIFRDVDDVFARSLAIGDPLIALDYIRDLQKSSLLKGLAIAKLLYRIKQSWNLYEVAGVGDSFENLVAANNGYAPATQEKYIRMWESIFENGGVDEDTKNKLSGRPIGDLLLMTAAIREGSLSDDDLERLTVAEDTNKVRDIIRKARGDVTSSRSALLPNLMIRPDGVLPVGTLYFYSDGELKTFGSLDVGSDDEDVNKMIARLVNRLSVREE